MRAQLAGFLAVFLALDAGLHYYIWVRLVRDVGNAMVMKLGTFGVIGLAILLPAGIILSRALPRVWARPVAWGAFVWMGTVFYLFLTLLALDALRATMLSFSWLWATIGGAPTAVDSARRALLSRTAVEIAGLSAGATALVALHSGTQDVHVREVGVKLARLPPALDGLTLVQLTDVHIGPTIGRRFLESVVEKSNRIRPDVVVITGDLVDGSVAVLREHVAPLAQLKARYGVYFVTGNHEYYSGVDEWVAELSRMGLQVLRNRLVSIGERGASFDLAGVDDHLSHQLSLSQGSELEKLLSLSDKSRELVLLSHQPKTIVSAAEAGVGLQLSGHTHGGQLWPFSELVALTQPYLEGLHRHTPSTQIYVSRGTGYWGPPMRFLAPAEVTKIVLGVG